MPSALPRKPEPELLGERALGAYLGLALGDALGEQMPNRAPILTDLVLATIDPGTWHPSQGLSANV